MSAAGALQLPVGELLEAQPSGRLCGSVEVPGDKSISHRALILAGMAEGTSRIEGLLESDDVLATLAAVRAFGAAIEREGDGWAVTGGAWRTPPAAVDCGNSGTGARLLLGAAAGFPLQATFTGDASLSRRPMGRVIEPLRQMGARFEGGPTLPVTLHGHALAGIRHVNSVSSAQVKSAILLAGLRATGVVEVVEPLPSRDHSERMLRRFGCDVEVETRDGYRVSLGSGRNLAATDVRVPGDPSSAAFLLVAALITPRSAVTVRNLLLNPLRTGLLQTLVEMGADISIENEREQGGEPVGDVTARSSELRGVEVPAERAPSMIDEYPILAVAAAFARGSTVMGGLAELRVKESDRLAAIVDMLRGAGVEAKAEGETLTVTGEGLTPRGGCLVATQGDHRIAMSGLVLGLAAQRPARVDQPDMIATSFPGFQRLMNELGADIGSTALS